MKKPNSVILNASTVSLSELGEENSIYMSVRLRMFSTRENANGVAVTEAFIDEIVENQEKYICIPVVGDVRKLSNSETRGLGHMFNERTQEFLTEQIGSFYNFEREETEDYGISLIGEARIMKRNKEIVETIAEMYEKGQLNFSFEITTGEAKRVDGVTIIDASDKNNLIGMCIVSVPAYTEAKALALVAEVSNNNRIDAMTKNAVLEIAEADLDTITHRLFRAMEETFGDDLWEMNVERIGRDFVILYSRKSAKTFKLEYAVDSDDRILITDFYEVMYTRKEREDQMAENTNKREMELETQVSSLNTEVSKKDGEIKTLNETVAQLNNEIAELKASSEAKDTEIASLKETEKKYDQLLAEKKDMEVRAQQAEMTENAKKLNLNVEDKVVAEAIKNLDAVGLLTIAAKNTNKSSASVTLSSDMGMDGDEFKLY